MTPPLIYLNNAATTWPKPQAVADAIQKSLSMPYFGFGRTSQQQGCDYLTLAREKTAGLLGAYSQEVIFTSNATDSLNILIAGFLQKNKGCRVLTTALDHNSVLRPLYAYQKSGLCTYDIVPFDEGHVSAETVADFIRPKTKLMVMSHASNVLGSLQDIQTISEILHEKGIYFIVDGAQSAGHIKIDFASCGADAFVFTGHKALFGITGTGGFLIKEPDRIASTRFGGTGTFSKLLVQPEEMPERFEVGTHNYIGCAALCAGIDFISSVGQKEIHEKGMRQSRAIICELCKEENITVHYKSPDVPVISFNIDGLSCDDVGFILARKFNIITRTGLHCAPLVHEKIDGGAGSVRLSLSVLTSDSECSTAAEAVREVAQNAAR